MGAGATSMPSPRSQRQPRPTLAGQFAKARIGSARASQADAVARQKKMKRLGEILRRLRQEQGLSTYQLAEATGLHRSRITYLEAGIQGEIGLEKFSRLIAVLGASADQVLREAGFLPAKSTRLAERRTVLVEHFGLSPRDAEETLTFLGFLEGRAKTQKRVRRPKSRGSMKREGKQP